MCVLGQGGLAGGRREVGDGDAEGRDQEQGEEAIQEGGAGGRRGEGMIVMRPLILQATGFHGDVRRYTFES